MGHNGVGVKITHSPTHGWVLSWAPSRIGFWLSSLIGGSNSEWIEENNPEEVVLLYVVDIWYNLSCWQRLPDSYNARRYDDVLNAICGVKEEDRFGNFFM